MTNKQAITAFSQSEKIKAALIWSAQIAEMLQGLSEDEKPGAKRILYTLVQMLANEVHLCRKAAPHDLWNAVDKHLDKAIVMINSGIAHEAAHHLTMALTQVTSISQQAMTVLVENELL